MGHYCSEMCCQKCGEINCACPDTPAPIKDSQAFDPPKGSFQKDLENLINHHSIEGGSDTPDFILAEYMRLCLDAFDMATRRRTDWYK